MLPLKGPTPHELMRSRSEQPKPCDRRPATTSRAAAASSHSHNAAQFNSKSDARLRCCRSAGQQLACRTSTTLNEGASKGTQACFTLLTKTPFNYQGRYCIIEGGSRAE